MSLEEMTKECDRLRQLIQLAADEIGQHIDRQYKDMANFNALRQNCADIAYRLVAFNVNKEFGEEVRKAILGFNPSSEQISGEARWQTRAETAETLLEEARMALGPFIRLADNVFSDGKNATVADEVTLWCFNDTDITFGDLRRALATLDRIGK